MWESDCCDLHCAVDYRLICAIDYRFVCAVNYRLVWVGEKRGRWGRVGDKWSNLQGVLPQAPDLALESRRRGTLRWHRALSWLTAVARRYHMEAFKHCITHIHFAAVLAQGDLWRKMTKPQASWDERNVKAAPLTAKLRGMISFEVL